MNYHNGKSTITVPIQNNETVAKYVLALTEATARNTQERDEGKSIACAIRDYPEDIVAAHKSDPFALDKLWVKERYSQRYFQILLRALDDHVGGMQTLESRTNWFGGKRNPSSSPSYVCSAHYVDSRVARRLRL